MQCTDRQTIFLHDLQHFAQPSLQSKLKVNDLFCFNGSIIIQRDFGPWVTECTAGMFGDNCERECLCKDPEEACDKVTGKCHSGCRLAHRQANCQERKFTQSLPLQPHPTFSSVARDMKRGCYGQEVHIFYIYIKREKVRLIHCIK